MHILSSLLAVAQAFVDCAWAARAPPFAAGGATAWAASTLAGLLPWMERLRRAGNDFEQLSLTLTAMRESFAFTWRPWIREACAHANMHEHHGSAVAVVHTLAGGFFGFKGTRRRRFRRPLLGYLAGSQQGRLFGDGRR